ncbi:MAG: hypothetical protein SF069_01135 [Phycisphaerae bacterium]|nr:hypothetical protein [Phycisphaerae bacterium]
MASPTRLIQRPFLHLLLGTTITLLLTIIAPWIESSIPNIQMLLAPPFTAAQVDGQWRQIGIMHRWSFDIWHSIRASGVSSTIKPEPVPSIHPEIRDAMVTPIAGEMPTMIQAVASGWPFRAAMYLQWSTYPLPDDPSPIPRRGLVHNWRISRLPFSDKFRKLDIPMQPLWRGLVFNIAIWSAASWCFFSATGLLKRSLRRRRGLCATCGYDLRGSSDGRCPECGTVSRPSRQTA